MSLASRKLIQATAGATTVDTGDDDFANVVLLLDGDGTSGDDNNTFTDSSTNGFTITESGSVAQGSFSPYGDNWSNYFGGDSGLNFGDVTAVDFDANDWTMELWWNPQDLSTGDPFVFKDNVDTRSFQFRHQPGTSGEITFLFWSSNTLYNSDTTDEFVYSAGFDVGEWYHIALVHDSGTFECFVNGTSIGTWTPAANNIDSGTDTLNVGYFSGGTPVYASGYLSSVRVVNGTALYTSSFTPSASPLTAVTNTTLLTCQSNRFKDNSSNDYSVTLAGSPKVTPFSPFKDSDARDITTDGGSGYFDLDDTAYLSFSGGPSSVSDMTISGWVYPETMAPQAGNAYPRVFAAGGFLIYVRDDDIRIYNSGEKVQAPINNNEWTYFAAQRNSNTWTLYINGVSKGTASDSSNIALNSTNYIGSNGASNYFTGYIADLRIATSGSTSTAVPTSPVSAVTNTELLLNFQDAGIYDRSGINNLDTVGDARLGFAPIYGTGSLAFDGTGDYLEAEYEGDLFDFGSADWTMECWVYLQTDSDSRGGIIEIYKDDNNYIRLFRDGGPDIQLRGVSGGSTQFDIQSSAQSQDAWIHIAGVRDGSTIRLFVDGTQVGTDTSFSIPDLSGARVVVGLDLAGTDRYFTGFIDDLRITKGVARYTSNFTPPDEIDLSTDTHREYVTLFLDGDGTVNGQNNTFTDSSTNSATITETGSVVQGVFSPYGDNWANYFDGSGDYLGSSSSDFAFGTGDFTAEFWFYATSIPSATNILDVRNGSSGFVINFPNGVLGFYSEPASSYLKQSSTLNVGEWYHVAAVRNGTDFDLYVNGTAIGSSVTNSSNFTANTVTLGARYTRDQQYFPGYISNVRLVKGTAVYTSNFTAPTAPLTAVTNTKLLTCASNRFADESAGDHSLTPNGNVAVTRFSPFESNKPYDITVDGGSGYFDDSSNSYLQIADNSVFDATSSLCIEAWFYMTSAPGDGPNAHAVVNKWVSTTPGQRTIFIDIESTGLRVYADIQGASNPVLITTDGGAISQHEWHHVAVTWDGSTYRAFLDGVLEGSTSSSSAPVASSQVVRVGHNTNTHYFGGYITDVRWVTDGGAIYTSAFTPPTSPLAAITNTELLLSFQDSAIPDLSGLNNIDTVGNAKVGGTDPTKYGSNAMQFDGSGDYLLLENNMEVFEFGSGDFTIEFWLYTNDATDNQTLIDFRPASTSGLYPLIYIPSGSTEDIRYRVNGTNRIISSTISSNAWIHVAVARSGSSTKLFINGTQQGSTYADSNNYALPSRVVIGAGSFNLGGAPLNGFIDDLRITKGIARYTSNFTAPTDALPKF